MTPPPLFHYTCRDHGFAGIGTSGFVIPPALRHPDRDVDPLAWFTDLTRPNRDALGLTMHTTTCDRTTYRYRVTDTAQISRWTDVRRSHPLAALLEGVPGARPAHWFVAVDSVPVVLDQVTT